jgi:hypothetical protein
VAVDPVFKTDVGWQGGKLNVAWTGVEAVSPPAWAVIEKGTCWASDGPPGRLAIAFNLPTTVEPFCAFLSVA